MKFVILIISFLITACAVKEEKQHYVFKLGQNETAYLKDVKACPKLHIKRSDSVLIQKEGKFDAFEIIASGYSGHCYFNDTIKEYRAVVKPEFKVVRLSDTDITDIHFSYYLETAEGPKSYMGKKTYFVEVSMPQGTKEVKYIPDDAIEMTIPKDSIKNADIYLGLKADASELLFRK